MHQRDPAGKARKKALDGLGGERNLGHQDKDTLAAGQHLSGGAQVDLGLPGSGDADQQVRFAPRRICQLRQERAPRPFLVRGEQGWGGEDRFEFFEWVAPHFRFAEPYKTLLRQRVQVR